MKRITITTILLLVCAGILGCTQNQDGEEEESIGEIKNPVLPGDRPDPTVIKIGETYWASATSNEWSPLFPIFKSDDLQHWELVTYVFPEGAPGWAVNNFWAPELAYDVDQDKVYVYYTARDKESGRLSTAVASADQPEGPYSDHGPLVAQELGSIDGYEARDRDGTLYLLWKEDGNSRGEPTPMWAQEMTEDRTELIGEKHELFRNEEEWEMHLVEGISVFREGNYFYALYSAGSCCDIACNYRTGVARSETL
ncbi:MAG: family 43 glycosylhydrolase, partial [Bacteroidetes bacterium]|nr:family 43 glycosylhydrolase [Bacteroidota bacterium]